jgi:cysteine desulfurase
VDEARQSLAAGLGVKPAELIFTSGATESNNLAIRGAVQKRRAIGRHIVSVTTEHPSVLDPLARLGREGYQVTLLPVIRSPDPQAGRILPQQVADAIRKDTILISVMLANNEMGAIHPVDEIAQICNARGVLLHCDATQAVGKIPLDLAKLPLDLLSFSGHKIYGPKGIGALFVRRRVPPVRLQSQIDGGGQEAGLRSGTLNVPGIIGLAKALELCLAEMPEESDRLRQLRNRLYDGLSATMPGVTLNGPTLDQPDWRLPGNLNVSFAGIDGEALLLTAANLALSSGSACSSAKPEPSHVLRAMGLDNDGTRSSVRFGLGRFNTAVEVETVIAILSQCVGRLRNIIA